MLHAPLEAVILHAPLFEADREQRCADPRFACLSFLLICLFFRNLFFLRFEIQPTPLHKNEKMILRNIWAKKFLYRNCFSFCFVVSSNYFVFWLRKLLSATKTTKNPKTSNKNQKKTKKQKTTKDSEECLRQGLCSKAFTRKKKGFR